MRDQNIPAQTRDCQPCCEGFFCPICLTCMIPCPLGSHCPTTTLDIDTDILTNYLLQCRIILVVEQTYGNILKLVASCFVQKGRIVQQVLKTSVAAKGIALYLRNVSDRLVR